MSREDQIDWLCRLKADLNNGVIFTPWNKEFIKALNSVLEQEPKTEWIPVSERLPEESDTYTVTVKSYPESKPYTDYAYYNALYKKWEDEPHNEHSLITDITNEVTAWMLLPKPYES